MNKRKAKAKMSKILLSSISVFFSVFVIVFMGFSVTAMNTSCSTTESYGNETIISEEMTTGHRMQNILTAPFRIAGGLIIYPLKAVFVDFPSALYDSFGSELDEYAKKLREGNQREKEEALFFLVYVKNPDAWKLILKAFDDNNPEIRKQAILSYVKRKDIPDESVHFIRALLLDKDFSVRLAAIYALGEIGTEDDITILREIYKDEENAEVFKSFALLSLSMLGVKEAETEALIILKQTDKHPMMYANALLCIGHCGMKIDESAKILRDSVLSEDERMRTAAITSLGAAKEFDYLEGLLLSKEISDDVKKKILIVLGEYGGTAKIDVIKLYLMRSKNDELRQYAVYGLARARYKPIVGELIENLRLDSPEINRGERKSQTIWTRLWSLSFLFELTGQNFGIDYKPWKKWWDSEKEEFLESTSMTDD
ncbi:MAG: HEAT repeat domain-containing protein [Planctomycetes bacterium]|nr:HEAT repeat domain-containing protein [Planctomycetota bacterium]